MITLRVSVEEMSLRHSMWAVLALWELGATDSELMEMLRDTGRYIVNEIEQLNLDRERAITCAVLHKLLTTDGVRSILVFQEAHRQAVIKRIESVLVERFDSSYGSWDIDRDIPETAGIDNALFVLTSVNARACIDNECVKVFQTAVKPLCNSCLVGIDENTLGLPFYDGGIPDIGASLQLLWIIYQNRELVDVKKKVINQLLNFVIDPSSRDNASDFAYPWHLASALCLSSEYA